MEIIPLVEKSELSVKQTLEELNVPRSSFYRWDRRYGSDGYEGFANRSHNVRRFWNKIPESEKKQIVKITLENP